MKKGDLVRMKHDMWWKLRSRKVYTSELGVVLETHHNAVKVLMSGGGIMSDLAENWKVLEDA